MKARAIVPHTSRAPGYRGASLSSTKAMLCRALKRSRARHDGRADERQRRAPMIPPMLALVRESVAADVPVIGIASAVNCSRRRSAPPSRASGEGDRRGEIEVLDTPGASECGVRPDVLSYHWHGETFSIPRGAHRICRASTADQAFVYRPHSHAVPRRDHSGNDRRWCETGADEIERNVSRSPRCSAPSKCGRT